MHASSGLTEQVRASTVTLGEAETMVLDYIKKHVPEPKSSPLCGNSIATDRGFLARDMPALDEHLHYRMIDVSSIKELAKRWYPRVYQSQPAKGLAHRALADIHESVQELTFYRQTLFVPQPGPSLDEARQPRTRFSTRGRAGRLTRLGAMIAGHGGCSSAGRAPRCGRGCRGFKSRHSPHAVRVGAVERFDNIRVAVLGPMAGSPSSPMTARTRVLQKRRPRGSGRCPSRISGRPEAQRRIDLAPVPTC